MPATDYRSYELTGDLLTDRAHYVAAGRPADHPYIVDCATRVDRLAGDRPAFVEPLAIQLAPAQADAMAALGPVLRAQSDANVAAMLRSAR